MSWYLYILRTRFKSLYTGITTDVDRRLTEHAGKRGAKYLRSKGPLTLTYHVQLEDHSEALRVERRIKKLSKARKEQIVSACPKRLELLTSLGLLPEQREIGSVAKH